MSQPLKLASVFPVLAEEGAQKSGRVEITGLHSGNLGDIIYSLPTAYALGITHYVINVCADPAFGSRSINSDSAMALAKLLVGQGSLCRVSVIQTHVPWEYANPKQIGIDYVLDAFRINWIEEKLHLIFRHALPFGIKVKATEPWMDVSHFNPSPSFPSAKKPYLVVALTERYRRFDNDFYQKLFKDLPEDQLFFVGVEGDLPNKHSVPGRYLKFDDLRDLALFISQAALLIGNPSFPYALAEACKLKRLLEIPDNLNVHPLEASGCAMHLLSFDELRRRIFEALQLPDQAVPLLHERLGQLELRIRELESLNAAVQGELESTRNQREHEQLAAAENFANLRKEMDRELVELRSQLTRALEERESLKHNTERLHQAEKDLEHVKGLENRYRRILESPGLLFRRLLSQSAMSFAAGRALHARLARSARLKALWKC